MALNPEPPFRKVASIKYIWRTIFSLIGMNQTGLILKSDFKRKDIIQTVLKRKKIKDIHEYDGVIDNIVVAEQRGKLTMTR